MSSISSGVNTKEKDDDMEQQPQQKNGTCTIIDSNDNDCINNKEEEKSLCVGDNDDDNDDEDKDEDKDRWNTDKSNTLESNEEDSSSMDRFGEDYSKTGSGCFADDDSIRHQILLRFFCCVCEIIFNSFLFLLLFSQYIILQFYSPQQAAESLRSARAAC